MGEIFDKAVQFAFQAHKGQFRKDGTMYILHPLETAAIVSTMTKDEDILAAAVLHDTVEDTPVTAEDIRATFGDRIADLVAHETENKRPDQSAANTWKIRKEESLAVLKDCSIESKMIWIADKLSNMRSLLRIYEDIGLDVFKAFNEKDPKEQRWYHATVLEYTKELSDYAAYKEYRHIFKKIFDSHK